MTRGDDEGDEEQLEEQQMAQSQQTRMKHCKLQTTNKNSRKIDTTHKTCTSRNKNIRLQLLLKLKIKIKNKKADVNGNVKNE